MIRRKVEPLLGRIQRQWLLLGLMTLGACVTVLVVVQLAYPWDRLPLYSTVDSIEVGGKSRQEAVDLLNQKYAEQPMKLYFGDNKRAHKEPRASEIGLAIDTKTQVDKKTYEWWLRLIPTSLWWAHHVTDSGEPSYQHDEDKAEAYVTKELGKSCDVKPQNATVKYEADRLQVVSSIEGGKCDIDDVKQLLVTAKPRLGDSDLRVRMDTRPAALTDEEAEEYVKDLEEKTLTGVTVVTGESKVTVNQDTLLSWLIFKAPNDGITAEVSAKKSKEFFDEQLAPKVTKPAGTSYITTFDFTVTSRKDGAVGRALDAEGTRKAIEDWLAGSEDIVSAKVGAVAPRVIYTRKYGPTDTGISALITHFAQSNPGIYGVSFMELDGKKRRAAYQDTTQFRTASTYKLFVAYSTLKRIEDSGNKGKWSWNTQVTGGRTMKKCFDDMIVLSDNPCAETLLTWITPKKVHEEIRALGLSRTTFVDQFIMTTAGDLTTFVGALQTSQLPLSSSSRNTLLAAMERNVYRQGIPAGAKGTVADKVGFLEDYLNDAAIVYSPTGTYALSIMTKGSSWGAIAELTRQIEKLRTSK